jgi:hypothetical protein
MEEALKVRLEEARDEAGYARERLRMRRSDLRMVRYIRVQQVALNTLHLLVRHTQSAAWIWFLLASSVTFTFGLLQGDPVWFAVSSAAAGLAGALRPHRVGR